MQQKPAETEQLLRPHQSLMLGLPQSMHCSWMALKSTVPPPMSLSHAMWVPSLQNRWEYINASSFVTTLPGSRTYAAELEISTRIEEALHT